MALAISESQYPEENAQHDLMKALSALHVGGKYSDITLRCGSRQWACHKAIICSRSGFFDGACSSEFREASSGVIDLSEDDESAVEQMIHFFYHLDYLNEQPLQQPSAMFRHRAYSDPRKRLPKKLDLSQIEDPLLAQAGFYAAPPPASPTASKKSRWSADCTEMCSSPTSGTMSPPPELEASSESDSECEDESTENESHLILHTQVYALAEKYDIPSLKSLARRKFEMAMACYFDAPEFAEAVEEAYCSTIESDRGLRDIVLQAFRTHPQLVHTQDIYDVIQNTPSLALDLFKLERGLPI